MARMSAGSMRLQSFKCASRHLNKQTKYALEDTLLGVKRAVVICTAPWHKSNGVVGTGMGDSSSLELVAEACAVGQGSEMDRRGNEYTLFHSVINKRARVCRWLGEIGKYIG